MGLGDRIAVLNHGRVAQIGTPQDIYLRPSDTFVATFIGSPPMNLIEDGDTFFGFRPEALVPAAQMAEGAVRVPLRIKRVEYLGAEQLIYGTVEGRGGDAAAIARIPANLDIGVGAGEVCDFALNRHDVQRFDRSSGWRLAEATP